MSSTIRDYYNPSESSTASNNLTATLKIGEYFVATGSYVMTSAKMKFLKVGTPAGNVTLEVFAVDESNLPTGDALATSDAIAASSFPTSEDFVEFTFQSPPTLINGTTYAIVVGKPSGAFFVYLLGHGAGNPYANGGSIYSNDSGSTWNILGVNTDMYFETYGTDVPAQGESSLVNFNSTWGW